jgi:hypothetical protein
MPRTGRTSGMHAPFIAPREGARVHAIAAKAPAQARKHAFNNVAYALLNVWRRQQ